ncbi:Zn finger family DNA binding protein [Favolaschia claudopus]|uniref:Zn finger family DNA binding protein n=1 Tax=Favolaschia claudopus TaxID=2862362 RepID=A0AAV9ZUV4_9AGAR
MLSHHAFPVPRSHFAVVPHDPQTVPRASLSFLNNIDQLVDVEPFSRPSSGTVDDEDSPRSPSGPNYHYASAAPRASISPAQDFYDNSGSYTGSYSYSSDPRKPHSFRAPSPSPVNPPLSAPSDHDRFPAYPAADRRYGMLPRISTSDPHRRMSDPTSYMPQEHQRQQQQQQQQQYSFPNTTYDVDSQSPHSPDSPFVSRVASLGSLRQDDYSPWKTLPPPIPGGHPYHSSSSFSSSPPLQYTLRTTSEENTYGPSPPGTASSSSTAPPKPPTSTVPLAPASSSTSELDPSNKKTYSFVALPGNAVRKRPRRRYDEIERLYQCSWPECNKAYGTLNHLNAHVQMQKHGAKRSPNEFKELRKQWRKEKKEFEMAASASMNSPPLHHPLSPHHASSPMMGMGMGMGLGMSGGMGPAGVGITHGPIRRSMSMGMGSGSGITLRGRGEQFEIYPTLGTHHTHPHHHPYAHATHQRSLSHPQPHPTQSHSMRQEYGVGGGSLMRSSPYQQEDTYPYSAEFRSPPMQQQPGQEIFHSPLSVASSSGGYSHQPAYIDTAAAQMMSVGESPPAHGSPGGYHSPTRLSGSGYPSPAHTTSGRLQPDSMLLTPLVGVGTGVHHAYAAPTGPDSGANSPQSHSHHASGDEY